LNKLGEAKRIFAEKPILFPTKDGPGVILKGAKFNFGVGTSEKEADYYANEAKRISVEAGLRARRGELPGWAKKGIAEAGGIQTAGGPPGQLPGSEKTQEVDNGPRTPQADEIVPDALKKKDADAEKRNAPVDAGDEPAQGKAAEAGPGGAQGEVVSFGEEAQIRRVIKKIREEEEVTAIAPRAAPAVTSDVLSPADPVPELAKGERIKAGDIVAWVEEVQIRGKAAWVAKHTKKDSGLVLTEGGVGYGLWTKGQAIERAARNLREARASFWKAGGGPPKEVTGSSSAAAPAVTPSKPSGAMYRIEGAPPAVGDTVYFLQGWNKDPQKIEHINSDGDIRIKGGKAHYSPSEFTRKPTLAGTRKSKPFTPAAPVPAAIAKKAPEEKGKWEKGEFTWHSGAGDIVIPAEIHGDFAVHKAVHKSGENGWMVSRVSTGETAGGVRSAPHENAKMWAERMAKGDTETPALVPAVIAKVKPFSAEVPDGTMTIIPTTDKEAPGTFDIIVTGKDGEVFLTDTADTYEEAVKTAERHAKEQKAIAKKAPEEVTHPLPTAPFSDRWTADRGAIPGEPSHFLDGETADEAKGVLIERVSDQGTSSWDGYINVEGAKNLPVAHRETFKKAAEIVENRVDNAIIEAGKGGENAPVLEGTVRREPGTLPAGSPGDVEGPGETGRVPGQPGGSGDRDGEEAQEGRPGRGSGRGTRKRLPVSEGEGESGGPVEEAVLTDVAPAVAAANEEFGLTPGKTDYVLTPEDVDFKGRGAKTRTKDNIAAIKLAMQLNEENRLATPEEQKTLVRYSGWGGLSDAFHGASYKQDWVELRRELYDLLDTETYSSARDSILNAHYTSIQVVDAMWAAVKASGFAGGRVLEPGAGIGNFLMRTPMDVKGKTRFTAVELDLLSGSILKQLNQSQDVRIQGYQETALSDNFYDLAISNVPFVETPILSDPRFTRQRFVLHDYYFAKTLDKVRPGGLIAFITSRYTMDKKDAKIREYIAGKADLLGAIRLPRTAFKANAATEVVTDIIFLKRRPEGEAPAGKAWIGLKEFKRGDKSADVNAYYAEHPENIIGNESFAGSMYGPDQYTVEPANEDLGEAVRHNAERFMAGVYEPRKIAYGAKKKTGRTEIQLEGISAIPESSFLVKEAKVYQRIGDKLVEVASSPASVKKYKTFIDLGAAARALVTNQLDPEYTDEQFNKDRGALNRLYDMATKGNVRLGHKTNQQFFGEDPNWNLIRALEHFDSDTKTVRKADILNRRVVQPNRVVESASSPRDALLITLRETGEINLPRIAQLLGTSEAKAWDAIRGDAYQTPEGLLEIRDKYLSGNVRKKLREAEAAAKIDPRFGPNVEALAAVIPEDVPPGNIYVNFGAPWIAPEYIDEFIKEVLEDPYTRTTFYAGTGTWGVERGRGYRSSSNVALLQTTYGTNRIDAIDIIALALNQQGPKIYDTVYDDAGNEKRVINAPETLAAKQRQTDLKAKFQSWLWEDAARTKILHRAYNDNFNSFVEPKHDGTKIYDVEGRVLVPGQNTGITLRATQINAVWRGLTEGNTLLWHEVGTGKTFIMAAMAMELRRTGAAKKVAIVVPKVIFGQIQQNFMTLFPNARILAPGPDDFKPANRKRFLYRIATGDWDSVILTKEHFQKIPPPADVEDEMIREALDELERAIVAEQGGDRGKRTPTLRQLIKLRDRLREQLQNLANVKRDEDTLTFDQLGIDYVMVDESHYFKNLRYTTRMNGVAGMGNPQGNKRSWDLYVKTTYLNRMTKNRGVLLSTGTPISNSIAELYTIQRYLSPDLLKELDIAAFDSWAATFASVETGYEITVDGGYKAKDRFSDFNNMPELSRMVRQVADTVTAQMAGVKRPTAERITVECPASQEYLDYQDEISKRAEAIRARHVDPHIDNFPKLSTDGRHAALDIRLRVPNAPDHPDSKVNKLVANVYEEYKKGKEGRLTQLVFMDLGVEDTGSAAGVRTYTDVKQKLLKLGIPPGELALIQDKKYDKEEGRLALYDDMNAGKVRILIGSTSKMSEGMNVQKRLVALHHMDPTWTPMGIMQREGRILRQGNTNETVRIYTYLTTGRGGKASFDAFMWQLMESKAGPISELQTNATPARTMGDVSGIVLNAAEWKALSTGNPLVVEKVKLQDEFNRLNALEGHHRAAQFNIPLQIERIMGDAKQRERDLALLEKDLAMLAAHPDRDVVTIGGKTFDVRGGEGQKDRMEAFSGALVKIREKMMKTEPATTYEQEQAGFRKVGEYRGYEITSVHSKFLEHGVDKEAVSIRMNLESSGRGFSGMYGVLAPEGGDGLRVRNMLDRTMNAITREAADRIKEEIGKQKAGAEALRKELGKPFKDAKRLKEVADRLRAVDMELGITQERAEDAVSAAIAQDEVLLDDEKGEAPEKPEGGGDGNTLYASPLDPALIAQAWRSLKASTEQLKERHRLAKSAKGLDLQWFNKQVNTPYYIFTEKFPRYRGVFDRMRKMMQERDDIAASLAEDAVSFFSGLEFQEKEAVNKLLIKGRYQRKVYTREELERDGRLSTKQIDAYFGIRAMLDRALDIYEDGIMYRVTKGKVQASSGLSIPLIKDSLAGLHYPDEKIEQIVKLVAEMRETKRKGYAPFARFGRFAYGYVHVGEDGTPDWQNPSNYFAKEETAWKAAEKYQALLKRFRKGIEEGRLMPVPPKELKQSEEAKLIQEIGGFELDAIKKIMDLDPEIAASLKEVVEQFFQAQGFRRHFFESKDSPGVSTDMERALADYIVSLSGFVSRLKGIPEMDNAAAGMERIPELARYYREWKNYSISPQEEFHQLRAGLFLYFLGGNVKSAAINLTQTFVTTIPWLTQYVSPFRAGEEVTRAVKDLTAAMGKREDGTFGVVIEKLPKDIREIVRRGYDEGIISEQLIYDLMGTARKPSSLRKLSKQKQRAVRGFGYLFSIAEKSNRLISLISAARIHMALSQKHQAKVAQFAAGGGGQEPPKPPGGGGAMPFEEDPFEFGKRATDETQFIYAKYNRPKMFRGWGSLLGTFRTFVVNFMEYLARLWGRKSIKAVGSVFVMLWAFSGLLGMPFAENVKFILEEITGMVTHKKPDLETAVREWGYDNMGGPEFMDYLLHGPFRHATGFDISASVGVGDILPFFDRNFQRNPLETIVGAPAEVLLKRPARAYGFLKEGQPYRAVESVAPEFLRNPMYAGRALKEGVLDRAGGQIVAKKDVTAADTAKKALGFMPTQIAKSYEREEAKARIGERSEQLKKDATRSLLNAIRIGDKQKALSILKSTGPKAGVPPEEWIMIDEKAIEKQIGETMLPPELRGLLKQPVLQRPAYLRMNKVYGGK
jgi:N12 class adenine-specific DNA methylase